MNLKRVVTFGVRGIPILPLLLMGVSFVAATLVATQTVSSSVTISTNFTFQLLTFTGTSGAACASTTTGSVFSTAAYGSVSGSTASTTNSTRFCYHNTGNSAIFVGQFAPESFFTLTTGSRPTGSTETLLPQTGTFSTTANYCIVANGYQLLDAATCTTPQVTQSVVLQLSVLANTAAGSYSWTDTFNGYSTATG